MALRTLVTILNPLIDLYIGYITTNIDIYIYRQLL